jgi:hypothetical protein
MDESIVKFTSKKTSSPTKSRTKHWRRQRDYRKAKRKTRQLRFVPVWIPALPERDALKVLLQRDHQIDEQSSDGGKNAKATLRATG